MMGGLIPGGMGMMPNTMLPNPMAGAGMFAGMVPNMANQGNVIQQNPVPIQQEQPVELVDPALRKVFVKNIPENTPDAFMESILKVRRSRSNFIEIFSKPSPQFLCLF